VHAAPDLGMFRRERTLLLGNDHTGAAELGDFALDEALIEDGCAIEPATRLVSAALHWLRERPRRDDEVDRVIAALPGVRMADGSSPFWNGLGRHFYGGDVAPLRARFGESWEWHLAALLPRHPLVVSILDEAAQAAIAATHPSVVAWRTALFAAGLRPGQHVAIHDGGPVYEAHLGATTASVR
jgi:arginine N-succinyltransferase